jgi:hypothetical protein
MMFVLLFVCMITIINGYMYAQLYVWMFVCICGYFFINLRIVHGLFLGRKPSSNRSKPTGYRP